MRDALLFYRRELVEIHNSYMNGKPVSTRRAEESMVIPAKIPEKILEIDEALRKL